MPAHSCLQPQHTYTDNNPQLNCCSSVNISWMADSSGLIIFSDLCLGFVFAFMNYKCMAKFVGKILISPPLHKVAVHPGKCVSAALLCLCMEQILPNISPFCSLYSILYCILIVLSLQQSNSKKRHWIEVEHHKLQRNVKKWQSSLVVVELILTFREKEKGTQENALDCVENKILISNQNNTFDRQFWINLHNVGVVMVLPNRFKVRR